MSPRPSEDDVLTVRELLDDCLALESDVRARQQALPSEDRFKRSGRTDLMAGRHYAIALTDLESARLRIAEAGRLEDEAGPFGREP